MVFWLECSLEHSVNLILYIWNVNWPVKVEAKMTAQGEQFCTSVLVSHATFSSAFCTKIHTKYFFKRQKWFYEFEIYFNKIKPSYKLYTFTKINYQHIEKSDETVSKNYLGKLVNACLLFTVSLPSLDNLAHFLGQTVIMNLFKISNK